MKKMFFLLFALILITSLACGGSATPPSYSPAPTFTKQANSPSSNLFKQTDQIYTHKSGAFQLPTLDSWKVEETDNSVLFTAPDEDIKVSITAVNLGKDFDQQLLEYYAYGVENSLYGQTANYQLLNTESNPDTHTVKIERSYSIDDKYYYGLAYFKQENQAIYSIELTAHSEHWTDYSKAFPAFVDTVKYDSQKAAALPAYDTTTTYKAPDETFSIEIPTSWVVTNTSPNADTIIDTITSPDGIAVIQVISYNNGYTWNQKWAGDTALSLLNNYYTQGSGDIKIIADVPIDNGKRERLDWTAQKGGYSGSTYFETHKRQLILFSLTYGSAYSDLYKPLLDQIADSYKLKGE